ncbi:sigma-54 interaction domain-containing protein [Sedimentibacter sp. MB31-C6]|uniref:sigma-54 interaction domain-containing protein n=1 Tax=Sedimentibacter sp. MB31-C6 TaxID=3109366 RepID=UPI002DDD49A3|nr:sigma 54-interacting transcriptional regulator [Sedimentibacter sp. MB36-C1]WSI02874.1 sigma 54-interacting transcriptional regulator [Sedimentibacter sp. MB36-C1]
MVNIEGLKFNSLDYVLIVDKEFTVVYNTRFDENVNASFNDSNSREYLNRNLFEIYPTIKNEAATSSIVRCITTGEIVVKKFQKYKDFKGNLYSTHNVTIPLLREGKIIGAVELVKDIKTIDNVNNDDCDKNYDDEDNEFINSIINDISNTSFESIITNDKKMLKAIEQAKTMSKMQSPTLIYGETGTGKEVFVQAMINYSGIPRKKVVVQNCAAIPHNLIESILFGTYRGAYTGAENKKGLFEIAEGGIIFLDELNSIPYDVQGKLLRVLQDGSFRPVGSNIQKTVNVKIVAAMNEDPLEAIKNNHLRKDLFYRLSSGMIYLPPLRERRGDIKLFIDNYIKEFDIIYNKNVQGITKTLEKIFLDYNWDGNVRELKHIIESMIGVADSKMLDVQYLPAYMYDRVYKTNNNTLVETDNNNFNYDMETYNLKKILEEKEIEIIKKVLKITDGNKTKAGKILGIPRQTLNYKIDKLKI